MPSPWLTLLLAGASFRLYRLFAKDLILDAPRSWLLGLGKWKPGMPVPSGYRSHIADFLTCAYCLGFWISLGWWYCWQQWPHTIEVASVPLAISAFVGLVAQLDQEE